MDADNNPNNEEVLRQVTIAGVADCEARLSTCVTRGKPWTVSHVLSPKEHHWQDLAAVKDYFDISSARALQENFEQHEEVREEAIAARRHLIKDIGSIEFTVCVQEPRCAICQDIVKHRGKDPKHVLRALEATQYRMYKPVLKTELSQELLAEICPRFVPRYVPRLVPRLVRDPSRDMSKIWAEICPSFDSRFV